MNQITKYLSLFLTRFSACFIERDLAVIPVHKNGTPELKFNFYRIYYPSNLSQNAGFHGNSLKI
jgi:hypothetical protein